MEIDVEIECEHCHKVIYTTVTVDVEPNFDMHELD